MKRRYYFLFLVLFTALVWTASWLIRWMLPDEKEPGLVFFQFAYYTILTGTIHLWLRNAATGRPVRFVNAYMLASTFKLLFSLTVILVVTYRQVVASVPFVIHFSALYLVYTIFEITIILHVLRGGKNK